VIAVNIFKDTLHCEKYIACQGEGLLIQGLWNAINLRGEAKMNLNIEPCWAFINNTSKEQIYHVAEEVAEVVHALKFESRQKLILEVLDVIQSCITLLAILGAEQGELDYWIDKMREKNSTNGRNYYSHQG
jgi:phosphoribosyl-ATP pyrophosphohydrolase